VQKDWLHRRRPTERLFSLKWLIFTITCCLTAMIEVSCSSDRNGVSSNEASKDRTACDLVTKAIDRGDWNTLLKLAKPGMRANESIAMWENFQRSGRAVRVGKLIGVEKNAALNAQQCTKYSFALESKDGTASAHWLQVLVREQSGQGEILDFWNFGW
jgi:hypothetical protein